MQTDNHVLEEYLSNEIQKLMNEIEKKKGIHFKNQQIIEESKKKINEYKDREDDVFGMLSPIATEFAYKEQVDEEEKRIDRASSENLSIIREVEETKDKIEEIKKQLEACKKAGEYELNQKSHTSNDTVVYMNDRGQPKTGSYEDASFIEPYYTTHSDTENLSKGSSVENTNNIKKTRITELNSIISPRQQQPDPVESETEIIQNVLIALDKAEKLFDVNPEASRKVIKDTKKYVSNLLTIRR